MWQKPAQPSASIYRRPTAGPASALSIAICYSPSFCLPASILPSCPRPPSCVFFPFSSCCARAPLFSSLLPSLITVGVARQQPVHRAQANFLPAVILFRPSLSRSHFALGLSRPLRRLIPFLLPSLSLSSRRYLFSPRCSSSPSLLSLFFFSLDTRRRIHGCPSRSSTTVPTMLHCYYFNGAISPQPPSCAADDARRVLSISATLIDDNDFLRDATSAVSCLIDARRSSNL